jgi:hypothetical protein
MIGCGEKKFKMHFFGQMFQLPPPDSESSVWPTRVLSFQFEKSFAESPFHPKVLSSVVLINN